MKYAYFLINDHSKWQDAFLQTEEYLKANKDLQEKVYHHIRAFYEMLELVPQTAENVFSGHYFPYAEAHFELENAYALAALGFYTYSFVSLRTVLELGLLGPYFAVDDKEHVDIRPWITSRERTPRLNDILKKLRELPLFAAFDQKFNLAARIIHRYDELGGFVHRRGYRYSSTGQTLSNFNRFSERSFLLYIDQTSGVVRDLIIVTLLKYPVGMRGLPLSQKFGLNPPAGGFLEPHQVTLITQLIDSEERAFLQTLSETDPAVQDVVSHIESMADISEDEFKRQVEGFEKRFPNAIRKPNED